MNTTLHSLDRRRPPCWPPPCTARRAPIANASDASALSALPIAVSVAAPAMLLSGGVMLTVVAVEASAEGTVWVLERASDGARASVTLSAAAAGGALGGRRHRGGRDRLQRRLGAVGRRQGDRLHPERDRRRAAAQRAADAMRAPRSRSPSCWPLAAGAAQAGRTCEQQARREAANVQRAMTLAERTARALDASGAQVVVLARAGQDLSQVRPGLVAPRPGLQATARRWRVVHKLNQCGSAQAAVYRQGLGEFFLDDLHDYKAGLVVPAPGGAGAAARHAARQRRVDALAHAAPTAWSPTRGRSATSSPTSGRWRRWR